MQIHLNIYMSISGLFEFFSCEQIELPQNLNKNSCWPASVLQVLLVSDSLPKQSSYTVVIHSCHLSNQQPKKQHGTIRHVLWRHELRAHLECCQQFGTTLKLSRLADVLIILFKKICENSSFLVFAWMSWHLYQPGCMVDIDQVGSFFFARNHEVVLSCRPQRRSCGSKVASNEIGQIFFSRNMMIIYQTWCRVCWGNFAWNWNVP